MDTSTHAHLFALLAQGRTPLSPATARGILHWAKGKKDANVLAALARRDDIPEDVLEALGKEKHARVKIAYLSRKDRSTEELTEAVAGEKRVTVLKAIAESPEASEMLLVALASSENAQVRLAVMTNEATPPATAGRLLERAYADKDVDSWRLRGIIAHRPALHEHAVLAVGRTLPVTVNTLAGTLGEGVLRSDHLSPEAQMHLVTAGVEPLLKAASRNTWQIESILNMIVRRAVLDAAVVERLEELLNTYTSSLSPTGLRALKAALADRSNVSATGVVDSLEVARSGRPEQLAELAERLLTDEPGTERKAVANALGTNPDTPTKSLVAILELMDTADLQTAASTRCEDAEALLAIYSHAPNLVQPTSFDGLGEDRTRVANAVARALAAKPQDNHTMWKWRAISASDALDDEGVALVPWAAVPTALSGAGPETAKRFEALLASVGEDKDTWEIFTTVGATHPGSLGELLESTRLLAGK